LQLDITRFYCKEFIMSNLLSEQLLSLSMAAKKIPPYRGHRTNPSTIFRWIRSGVKLADGHVLKLEALRIAGRWVTSAEAIERFVAAQNQPTDEAPFQQSPRTPGQRRSASEHAGKQLEKLGV
jgi:hypothetical protein